MANIKLEPQHRVYPIPEFKRMHIQQGLYLFLILFIDIPLIMKSYHSSLFLVASILFLLSSLYMCFGKSFLYKRYICAAVALITLVFLFIKLQMPFSIITRYLYTVPFLYALALPDWISVYVVGAPMIYILTTYTEIEGSEAITSTTIGMVMTCFICGTIAYMIRRLKSELNMRDSIANISSALLSTTSIHQSIESVLTEIGQYTNSSHACVILLNDSLSSIDHICQWHKPGGDHLAQNFKYNNSDAFLWLVLDQLYQREYLYIQDVDNLPYELESLREALTHHRIKTLLVLPLRLQNELIGFIGIEQKNKVRRYNASVISFLNIIKEMLIQTLGAYRSKQALEYLTRNLEDKVEKRTLKLKETNSTLKQKIEDYIKLEGDLNKSKEKYQKLIEFLPDAVFIHDGRKILFANAAAAQLVGVENYFQIIGTDINQFVPADRQGYKRAIDQDIFESLKEHSLIEGKVQNIHGEIIDIELSLKPIIYEDQSAVLTVVRDITQRKESERLHSLLNETLEYEKLRTEFFANISHELRTPLNIILGTIQLLSMKLSSHVKMHEAEGVVKHVNMMRQNCFRLLRLINNLIDITKIDSGYFKIQLVNCNIVAIIEDICLSVVDFTEDKGLEITFDTDKEEIILACDPDKIERIMLNLLSNAIKFTNPGGKIFVNIFDKQDHIIISVMDTGIGIPNDKLKTVFERFRQVDKSLARNHEGSGIGLALVKSLVEMHMGKISAFSIEGEGTDFLIKLPLTACYENSPVSRDIVREPSVERLNIEFSDIYSGSSYFDSQIQG
ncbi:MASE3 domain-containing sensor histidine kinase [Anaerosolibacter sp.]|uniref:MASE3 domain-containing sensor histidine kinase n=1 Tax=Anaerosolibacter sp. TaxID=1872527 RepID=UPI0039F04CC3